MKLNNISLTYQGRGQQLLGICTGARENLELQFNSLFNRGALNGEPQWFSETMFEFWTSKAKMLAYFKSRLWGPVKDKYEARFAQGRTSANSRKAYRAQLTEAVDARIAKIAAWQMKRFLASVVVGQRKFNAKRIAAIEPDAYGMGTMTAERPDEKEAIETAAFGAAAKQEGYERAVPNEAAPLDNI